MSVQSIVSALAAGERAGMRTLRGFEKRRLRPRVRGLRRRLRRLRRRSAELRDRLRGRLVLRLFGTPVRVATPRGPVSFAVLGEVPAKRAHALLSKQPATITWIDSFSPGSVFWDVGANVGVYSLYAGLRGDLEVVAFEPAAVNHFLLATNCELNALEDRITCLQLGLGEGRSLERLEVSQLQPGLSFSFRGKPTRQIRSHHATLVMSADQVIEDYGLSCPNHLKIDVPGLTLAILRGGTRLLARPELHSLHIEANDRSRGGQEVVRLLAGFGFEVAERNVRRETVDLTFLRTA